MPIRFRQGWSGEPVDLIPHPVPAHNESTRLVTKDVYEGGDDVWECAYDLVDYLKGSEQVEQLIVKKGVLRVLEIGAGHGLPALAICQAREALRLPTQVILQDFNEETLLRKTRRVYESSLDLSLINVELVACSWETMVKENNSELNLDYDLVVSAETLYRKENFDEIIGIINRCLVAKPDALILFAQKRFYFGLGGGAMPFSIHARSTEISSEVVNTAMSGNANVRDILLISRKTQ
eukprot:Protomagalhaensia_wolfi_Nauph_80__423@NODE_1232_length_1644_cov_156_854206_g947_i0_p2_GENE_NODE_1232_length_1644_cov_156_854206_g947_i0NODE_1232_length_1644_cov_156_854206_g947_i0_p2_ORF_typecomplete_len237_score28_56Methyltransf_16/PF10294_9/2_5e18Methyltransf_31/PF13847_6/5e07Methyltransf_23/PF13489_6/2_5e06Ubie_methyltran/PF01209_18/0_0015MTS/PF05175_14/0_0045GidB/PF02527_15/0_0043Methyltransf_25/PF13649_6/0_015Methyltransf_20/PF12147_8/0_019Methyltransf_11/PF08241_12/0_069CMAS/PF02353_20/0_0